MPIGGDADGVAAAAGGYATSIVHSDCDALVAAYTLVGCEIIELFGVVVVGMEVAPLVVAAAAAVAMGGKGEVGCDHVSSRNSL